jgi:CRISPR type I-E/ECOLI-associated protein CasB/Cse2
MTDTQSIRQRTIAAFIAELHQLDAAGRARLKRNAGRSLGEARNVHRVFFQILPSGVVYPNVQEDYFLIATLFPLCKARTSPESFGATMRRVRQERSRSENYNSLDRRFENLIDSDREQLPFRLRQMVRLINASKEALHWESLLSDLLAWDYENRPVQLRWMRDYFGANSE